MLLPRKSQQNKDYKVILTQTSLPIFKKLQEALTILFSPFHISLLNPVIKFIFQHKIQIAASFDTLNDLVIESKVPLHGFQIDPWASCYLSMGFESLLNIECQIR
jgi:hypothetical protein